MSGERTPPTTTAHVYVQIPSRSPPHLVQAHRGLANQVVESLAPLRVPPHRLHRRGKAFALEHAPPTAVQDTERHPHQDGGPAAAVPHEEVPDAGDHRLRGHRPGVDADEPPGEFSIEQPKRGRSGLKAEGGEMRALVGEGCPGKAKGLRRGGVGHSMRRYASCREFCGTKHFTRKAELVCSAIPRRETNQRERHTVTRKQFSCCCCHLQKKNTHFSSCGQVGRKDPDTFRSRAGCDSTCIAATDTLCRANIRVGEKTAQC